VEIDLKISTNLPADLLDLSLEYASAKFTLRIPLGIHHQQADPADRVRLLRVRDERPRRCRTGKACDEFAPSHGPPLQADDRTLSRCSA
jgi:hypothetical protein